MKSMLKNLMIKIIRIFKENIYVQFNKPKGRVKDKEQVKK